MDRLLPPESLPQIENTRNEDADETAGWGYIDYSERNFIDLFDITNINEDQENNSSDNESGSECDKNETDEVP